MLFLCKHPWIASSIFSCCWSWCQRHWKNRTNIVIILDINLRRCWCSKMRECHHHIHMPRQEREKGNKHGTLHRRRLMSGQHQEHFVSRHFAGGVHPILGAAEPVALFICAGEKGTSLWSGKDSKESPLMAWMVVKWYAHFAVLFAPKLSILELIWGRHGVTYGAVAGEKEGTSKRLAKFAKCWEYPRHIWHWQPGICAGAG